MEGGKPEARLRDQGASAYTLCYHAPWRCLRHGGWPEMVAKGGGTNYWVDFDWDNAHVSFAEILEAVGELPIPPYLNRETEESDKTTYQTVYSKIKGSVAAPNSRTSFHRCRAPGHRLRMALTVRR